MVPHSFAVLTGIELTSRDTEEVNEYKNFSSEGRASCP